MDRKTRTEIVEKKVDFDMSLLPVVKNLAASGFNEADIGMLIGYAGKSPGKFLKKIQKKYPDVKTAFDIGKRIADTQLVVRAFEAACGYDYTEKSQEYRIIREENEETGEVTERRQLVKEKKNKKHTRPDAAILKMMLLSRLPDYFIESKKVNINETINQEATEEEVARFFGKLYEVAKKHKVKVIDSKETDGG